MLFTINLDEITNPSQLPQPVRKLLQCSGQSHFTPNEVHSFKSDEFIFNHHLFAFRPNAWYVAPDQAAGRGGIGKVFSVNSMIEFAEYGETYVSRPSTPLLIKRLTPGYDQEKRNAVICEAKYQSQQGVEVYSVLFSAGYGYILMEHCGPSLEIWLKQDDLTFDQRLAMVTGVSLGLLNAQQNELIHGDIKPSNLCYIQEDQTFYVRLIDCGATKKTDTGIAWSDILEGSALYLAPEVPAKEKGDQHEYSYASDIYAGAGTFGQLFGMARDTLLRDKISNETDLHACCDAAYDFSTLFSGITIPSDIDPVLLANIK